MKTYSGWDDLYKLADDRCGVYLEPLQIVHLDVLWQVAKNKIIWEHTYKKLHNYSKFKDTIDEAILLNRNGEEKAFAICLNNGTPIGATRIKKLSKGHLRVEIGDTWLSPVWQRTFVNTHAKFLLLTHAFDIMKCIRVEFKTDINNIVSRNAILRLGATEDGVFRNHMILSDGNFRDTVYFSIISNNWSIIKAQLCEKL